MRMLLIEDDEQFLQTVVPRFERIAGAPGNLTVAKSRDSAIEALNHAALNNAFYDVFILDLKIPTIDHGGDGAVEHGRAVFYHALGCAPRTPVYIFTESDPRSLSDVFNDFLIEAEKIDVWGDLQPIPTVQLKWKENLTKLLDELRSVACCVAETDEIEITRPDPSLQLNLQQGRVLRVFARRRKGRSCEVAPLEGGLSSSRVFRVTVKDKGGRTRIVAAGKIADIATVKDEVERFNRHVLRLEARSYPPIVDLVCAGAGLTGGVFYRLLDPSSRSLFSRLATNPTRATATVTKVRNLTKPWIAGEKPTQVADIRRASVGDEEADKLVTTHGLSWAKEGFEPKRIQARQACLHGDLHGGNILVDRFWTPLLIDFSEVDDGVASIDPITLELSLLFHPGFQHIRGAWPSTDTAALWADPSRYTQGCPCPAFIRACRDWCDTVAAGKREILRLGLRLPPSPVKVPRHR